MTTTTILTAGQYMVPGHPFGTATGTVVALTALPSGKTKVEVNNVLLLADVLQGGIGVDFNDPATFGGIAPDNSANGGPTIIVGAYPITTQVPPQRYPILNYCVIDTASGPVLYEIDTVISDTEFIVIGSVPAPATGVLFLSGFVGGTSSVAITSAGAWLMGGEGQVMQAMPAGSLTVGYGDDQVGVFLVGSNVVSVSVTLGAMVLGGSGGGGGGGGIISINGDVTPAQVLAAGSAGTDFAIATVLGTTTFNLPVASALNTGKLSSADWSTFNGKQDALILTTVGSSGAATLIGNTLNIPQYSGGVTTIGVLDSAAKSANGAVISGSSLVMQTADATNPGLVSTGTQTFAGSKTFSSAPTFTGFTAGSVLFAGASGLLSQDNANLFWDDANNRLGIGTNSPQYRLHIIDDTFGSGHFLLNSSLPSRHTETSGFKAFWPGAVSSFMASTQSTFEGWTLNSNLVRSITPGIFWTCQNTSRPAWQIYNGWGTATDSFEILRAAATSGSASLVQLLKITGSTANVTIGTGSDAGFRLDVNGTERVQGRLTVSQDTTVTTEVCAVITTDTTNANLVIAPNGTGALIADIPDGTSAGGNARGDNAVDLQISRNNSAQVASGNLSAIVGGNWHAASGVNSACFGGGGNSASSTNAVCLGGTGNVASNQQSTCVGGSTNSATEANSITLGGIQGVAYLFSQRASASGRFAANSDAQTSAVTLRRTITGTGISELFLNGDTATLRAILALNAGPTNARAWSVIVQVMAIADTVGNGTVVQNDCFAGTYQCAIKRVLNTTSMIGNVTPSSELSDTSMSSSVVTISADDTNEALKIEFTPPTTAGTTTVIRVVATAYLTEVGR